MSANSLLPPVTTKIVTATTVTTTTSYTFTAPIADCYGLWVNVGAGTGTSPTCDISLQHTPDSGTTWLIAPIRLVQVTTAASTQRAIFKIRLGENEAATQAATAATGGTLAANFVPTSMSWRLTATIGGTNPSFPTIDAWLAAIPAGVR